MADPITLGTALAFAQETSNGIWKMISFLEARASSTTSKRPAILTTATRLCTAITAVRAQLTRLDPLAHRPTSELSELSLTNLVTDDIGIVVYVTLQQLAQVDRVLKQMGLTRRPGLFDQTSWAFRAKDVKQWVAALELVTEALKAMVDALERPENGEKDTAASMQRITQLQSAVVPLLLYNPEVEEVFAARSVVQVLTPRSGGSSVDSDDITAYDDMQLVRSNEKDKRMNIDDDDDFEMIDAGSAIDNRNIHTEDTVSEVDDESIQEWNESLTYVVGLLRNATISQNADRSSSGTSVVWSYVGDVGLASLSTLAAMELPITIVELEKWKNLSAQQLKENRTRSLAGPELAQIFGHNAPPPPVTILSWVKGPRVDVLINDFAPEATLSIPALFFFLGMNVRRTFSSASLDLLHAKCSVPSTKHMDPFEPELIDQNNLTIEQLRRLKGVCPCHSVRIFFRYLFQVLSEFDESTITKSGRYARNGFWSQARVTGETPATELAYSLPRYLTYFCSLLVWFFQPIESKASATDHESDSTDGTSDSDDGIHTEKRNDHPYIQELDYDYVRAWTLHALAIALEQAFSKPRARGYAEFRTPEFLRLSSIVHQLGRERNNLLEHTPYDRVDIPEIYARARSEYSIEATFLQKLRDQISENERLDSKKYLRAGLTPLEPCADTAVDAIAELKADDTTLEVDEGKRSDDNAASTPPDTESVEYSIFLQALPPRRVAERMFLNVNLGSQYFTGIGRPNYVFCSLLDLQYEGSLYDMPFLQELANVPIVSTCDESLKRSKLIMPMAIL